jgi:ABC-type transport system involved in multi-copper enzyme maturation permease subunit
MIFHIAKKEFIENLMTLKFTLSFMFCLILVLLSVIISTRNYETRLSEYSSMESYNKAQGYSLDNPKFKIRIQKRPEVLSIFAIGVEKRLGNSFEIAYWQPPFIAQSYRTDPMSVFLHSQRRRFLEEFSDIDFVFIMKVIFSLLAIFLVYNTICGEKEHGQLRLILANSIPRGEVLIGKLLGQALCLLLPLIVSFVLSLIVLQFSKIVSLSSDDYLRIALIFLVSIIYLLTFLNLGLLVSCRTSASAMSLLFLLATWVWLLFVHPNFSIFAAEKFSPILPETRMRKQVEQVMYDTNEKFMESLKSGEGNTDLIMIQGCKERKKLYDSYLNQFSRQARFADICSKISFGECFSSILTTFAKTDLVSHDRWMNSVRDFWTEDTARQRAKVLREIEGKKEEKQIAPTFAYREESIKESLNRALPDILILLCWNILFFMLSYLFFLRYEV